jgi:hypothetical protein
VVNLTLLYIDFEKIFFSTNWIGSWFGLTAACGCGGENKNVLYREMNLGCPAARK